PEPAARPSSAQFSREPAHGGRAGVRSSQWPRARPSSGGRPGRTLSRRCGGPMKKLTIAVGLTFLCASVMAAAAEKKATAAKKEGAEKATLTGCLAKGDEPNT